MKFFLKLLIKILLSFLLLIVLSFIAFYIYKDKIINYIITTISNNLNATVNVSHVELEKLFFFPYITISFNNTTVFYPENVLKQNDTLIYARNIKFKLNTIALLNKSISIERIRINDGKIYLKLDSNNNFSFEIFKKQKEKNTVNNFKLYINKLSVSNLFFYLYKSNKVFDFYSYIKYLSLKGNINTNNLNANLRSSISSFKYNNIYIKESDIKVNGDIIFSNNIFSLCNSFIYLNKNKLQTDILYNKNESFLSAKIRGQNIFLNDLLKLYPLSYFGDSINFKDSKSDFLLNFSQTKNSKNLIIELNKLNTNLVLFKRNDIKIKNSYFTIRTNFKDIFIVGRDILAQFNGSKANLSFSYINNNLKISGIFNILPTDLNKLINDSSFIIKDDKGYINLDNTKLSFKKIGNKLILNNFSSIINLNNLSFIFDNKFFINNVSSNFSIQDSVCNVEHLTCVLNNNEISYTGKINSNLLMHNDNKNININGNVKSNYLNIDTILSLFSGNYSNKNTCTSLTIQLESSKISFYNILLNNIKTSFSYKPNYISLTNIECNTLNGSIKNGSYLSKDSFNSLFFDFKDINISKLFKNFNNFNQKNITSENLIGTISGNANINFLIQKDKIVTPSINGKIKIIISNGKLIAFEPAKKISQYVHIQNPEKIEFHKISNIIKIDNNRIEIPLMEVKANSLNFWISGYHTFNNEYDYRIKLYLSDIIRLRNKTYEKDLPIVEIDDSTHKSMVYIKYYGKDGQSSISYDSKSALKSFSSKLNEEKQNIKNIFVPKNNSEYKSYDNNKKPKLNFEESKDNKQNEDTKKPKKQEKRQKIEWQDE